jgi:hypothetical protein
MHEKVIGSTGHKKYQKVFPLARIYAGSVVEST